jgi:hypothetical protein
MMQQQPQVPQQQEQERQLHHPDWFRGMGMTGRGMMGRGGLMGPGGMHSGLMMRMLFALMDGDGDGAVSLSEFQAAHERIFRAMDANKDGRLTLEEIQAFMQGTRAPAPRRDGNDGENYRMLRPICAPDGIRLRPLVQCLVVSARDASLANVWGKVANNSSFNFSYIRQAQASNSTTGASGQRTNVSDCRLPRRAVPASTIVFSCQGVSSSD